MQSAVPDRQTLSGFTRPGVTIAGGPAFQNIRNVYLFARQSYGSSMELSSCPARPTKGSPRRILLRSGSLPDDEPIRVQIADARTTVCVRVALKGQRVHAATRALSSPQSAPASRRAAVSPVWEPYCPMEAHRPIGACPPKRPREWRAASKPRAPRRRDILAAARYSCVGAAGRLRRRSLR